MISASKTTFRHYNLKILRPKDAKNITNLRKKFCEFPPRGLCIPMRIELLSKYDYVFVWTYGSDHLRQGTPK